MLSEIEKDPLFSPKEAARVLNVHINTLRRWSDRGILKAYRITRRGDRRFKQDDVARLIIKLKCLGAASK